MNTNQPAVYDPLTRALHWLTVAGFIGILTTIVLWTIYEEAEWAGSLFGLHKSFGFLMLTVIALRIVWAVANRAKRPQSDSKAAAAGHGILYLLMLAVPVIGMIRQYGGGRGPLKVFGVEVMQVRRKKSSGWQTWATRSTAIWAGCCLPPSSDTSPWSSSIVFKAKTCCTA